MDNNDYKHDFVINQKMLYIIVKFLLFKCFLFCFAQNYTLGLNMGTSEGGKNVFAGEMIIIFGRSIIKGIEQDTVIIFPFICNEFCI